ncbi:MAG: hypothetical protein R2724_17825 [Bryobacterales bacterium]
MRLETAFLLAFAAALAGLFWWGFRTLPGEGWQFLASTATRRNAEGEWIGVNFTFYGLFSALAYTLAAALFVALSAAAGIAPATAFVALAAVVAICMPASVAGTAGRGQAPWLHRRRGELCRLPRRASRGGGGRRAF